MLLDQKEVRSQESNDCMFTILAKNCFTIMASSYQVLSHKLKMPLQVFDYRSCRVGRDTQTIFGLVTRKLRDEPLGDYKNVRPL